MIGERLKRARMAKGYSLQKLADSTGNITKQAISKYEHNKAIPSSDVLIRLSIALDVKPEYFFRSVQIEELKGIDYRKKAHLTAKKRHIIEETSKDILERYLQLEDLFSTGSPINTTFKEFKKYLISKPADIENATASFRNAWKLGFDPIENMVELLEDHGIKIIEIDCQDDNFEGVSGIIGDAHAFIAINKNRSWDRKRFTLAHELAHLVLNIKPKCPQKFLEKCCHRFAGSFLVPKERVYKELGEHRKNIQFTEWIMLKQKYGLSIQAWLYRARDLDIITNSLFKKLYAYLETNNYLVKEPLSELPSEKPTRFKRLLLHALAEGFITETRASDLLGIKTLDLQKVIKEWVQELENRAA